MPSSDTGTLGQVLNICLELNPNTILDIGCGFGKYGFLLREYLDVCRGNYPRIDWKKKIDAVEIFPPYITALQKEIYNKIWIQPIEEFVTKESLDYGLILFLDVIEHLSKKEGVNLLRKLVAEKNPLLVVTPRDFRVQGTSHGNIHETHLSHWKRKDFRKIGETQFFRNKRAIIVLFNAKVYRHTLFFKIKNLFWKIFIKKKEKTKC